MKSITTYEFEATGTVWEIRMHSNNVFSMFNKSEDIIAEIKKYINDLENILSRFKKDSDLNHLKNKVGKFKVKTEIIDILKVYFFFNENYTKSLTPLVGKKMEEMGYDNTYSLRPQKEVVAQTKQTQNLRNLKEAIEITEKNTIKINYPCHLDFGAIGKGYIIDKVYDFLLQKSVPRFVINAGGDIRFYSNKKEDVLKVGLEHPDDFSKVVGIVKLQTTYAICGSSNSRRIWNYENQTYTHIVNPIPVEEKKDYLNYHEKPTASWAVYTNCTYADAFATCIMLDKEVTKIKVKNFDVKYIIL